MKVAVVFVMTRLRIITSPKSSCEKRLLSIVPDVGGKRGETELVQPKLVPPPTSYGQLQEMVKKANICKQILGKPGTTGYH